MLQAAVADIEFGRLHQTFADIAVLGQQPADEFEVSQQVDIAAVREARNCGDSLLNNRFIPLFQHGALRNAYEITSRFFDKLRWHAICFS